MNPDIFLASGAWTPGAITTLAAATATITVPGAVVADIVGVSYDKTLAAGLILSAQVTANDTVTVMIFNATAGTLTPTAGTVTVRVKRAISRN